MTAGGRGGKAAKRWCPACGSEERIPILYGLPTDDAREQADRGEVALGGCLVDRRNPRWQCRACGELWGVGEGWPPVDDD